MKRVAIGEKNWYVLGSDDAGNHSAALLSIRSTCHRQGVNPVEYIKDVFVTLTKTPDTDIDTLLPQFWQHNRQTTEITTCQTNPELAIA